jgi:hypothetical protein
MKTTILFFILTTLNIYGQENPWVNTQPNPWVTETETPKTIKDSLILNNDIDSTSLNIKADNSNTSDLNFYKKGFKDTKANGGLVTGISTSLVLNVLSIIPSAIVVAIDNKKERNCAKILKEEFPAITKKEIRKYKSGIKAKRLIKTMSGCIIGSILQIRILGFLF